MAAPYRRGRDAEKGRFGLPQEAEWGPEDRAPWTASTPHPALGRAAGPSGSVFWVGPNQPHPPTVWLLPCLLWDQVSVATVKGHILSQGTLPTEASIGRVLRM